MNCWFEQSVTDSFGTGKLAPLSDGLALVPGSCCPHYDAEDQRRPAFHRLIGSDVLSGGWAADDGAALVFFGTSLNEVVTSRASAAAYRVDKADSGVSEQRLAARYLG
jgi:dipeptidase E